MSSNQQLQEFQQKIRIPLYGEEGMYNNAQTFFNYVPTLMHGSSSPEYILKPRLGIDAQTAAHITPVTRIVPLALTAITQVNGFCIGAVWEQSTTTITLYAISSAGFTSIGTILTGASGYLDFVHISELSINNVPYVGVVWIKNDQSTSKAYYAATTTGAFTGASLTQITDVDFPTQLGSPEILTGPMVQMNGTTYVMNTIGKIYNSDLNSISSWNSLGVIQAVAYPDKGIGLCRYKHHILALGQDSIEFFNDVGNASPASPLERTEQAFIKFGCANQNSFLAVEDTVYWVAGSSQGAAGLWRLEGYVPRKVSPTRYETTISSNANGTSGSAKLSYFKSDGTRSLVINGTTYPLCFCIDSESWWNLDITTLSADATNLLTANVNPVTQYCLISSTLLDTFVTQAEYGYLYKVDTSNVNGYDTKYDATTPYIQCSAKWNPEDFGNESRKFIRRLSVICDQNNGQLDNGAVTVTLVYFKDGRGNSNLSGNWPDTGSTSRTYSLAFGATRAYFNNLGACRDISIKVSSSRPLKISGLELIVAQGTN